MGRIEPQCTLGDSALAIVPWAQSPAGVCPRYVLGDSAQAQSPGTIAVGPSWNLEPQNLHLHLPHQVHRLGARVEMLDWVFSEASLSSRVLEVLGLRIQAAFKMSSLGKI
ncbi:hypothetical protein L6452_04606 [Arctium lappa]|uniref:Uncharacterized protein n=1 Tax=Arctium lappa TaxID=4217 RepID=A0ACB9EDJ6_ARCLA|nr:hypothetical protein L6452_04606 [Arctium lappa]